MADKYAPPQGPPPAYPPSAYTQQHYDAGPYPGQGPDYAAYHYQQNPSQGANAGYYGQSAPPPQQGYYGPQGSQGMQYQQQPATASQGYFAGDRSRSGTGTGFCAALLGALACCCCLDFIF